MYHCPLQRLLHKQLLSLLGHFSTITGIVGPKKKIMVLVHFFSGRWICLEENMSRIHWCQIYQYYFLLPAYCRQSITTTTTTALPTLRYSTICHHHHCSNVKYMTPPTTTNTASDAKTNQFPLQLLTTTAYTFNN